MKFITSTSQNRVLRYAMCMNLLGSLADSATPKHSQVVSDQKSKVKGTIVSRAGDVVSVKDKKPMRRSVIPAGYGATHATASTSDAQGRALHRRANFKVMVNKGLKGRRQLGTDQLRSCWIKEIAGVERTTPLKDIALEKSNDLEERQAVSIGGN